MLRFVLAAALFAAAPAFGQTSKDCSRMPTQLDANFCAKDGWAISDGELNRLWSVVKPAADARGTGQALLDAQRAWLRYRDATCEAEQNEYAGGSIAAMVYWSCMDRLTLQRNAELRAMF
ncbi:MAG: lysozyme inhibitor LprI family protein [Pseudomonadota bacterium]